MYLWVFASRWWPVARHSTASLPSLFCILGLYSPLSPCNTTPFPVPEALDQYLDHIQTAAPPPTPLFYLTVLGCLSTSAQLSSANMTGWADDDKCRGEKAITRSVRCCGECSGHSLPTDCGVHRALTHTNVHLRRIRCISRNCYLRSSISVQRREPTNPSSYLNGNVFNATILKVTEQLGTSLEGVISPRLLGDQTQIMEVSKHNFAVIKVTAAWNMLRL